MKLAAVAAISSILASCASACMIVHATYDVARETLLTGGIWDNSRLHCNLPLPSLSWHSADTASFSCYTSGWAAKIHHDGDMNFSIEVNEGGRTLGFMMEKVCEETGDTIMQHESGLGERACEVVRLRSFQYGCTKEDVRESESYTGRRQRRRGLASY